MARSSRWLEGAAGDVRQGWAALRRRPGYLITAGGALAAAVAANTLVFAMVYGVLLRPLPYRDPERLIRVYEQSGPQPKFPVSITNYKEDLRRNRTLAGIALYTREDMELMHGEQPERVTTVAITDTFFPTLDAAVAMGRNFVAGEMVESARVVIVSYRFWSERLGGDRAIVGKTLRLNRENWTVVGVAPRGFQHVGGDYRSPLQGETVAMWRPLPLDAECQQGCHYTNAVARLAPGVTLAGTLEDLNRIMDELAQQYPNMYRGKRARVEALAEEVVGKSRSVVMIVAAAGGLILLLAAINAAGLSIARALTRRREIAIRRALGGSGWMIARAVAAESLVLGGVAGAAGLAIAASAMPALRELLPAEFPRLHEIVLRWPDAAFALAAGLGASAVGGILSVARGTRVEPGETLHEDARGASTSLSTGRLRGGLVAAEAALACVLCFAAGLLVRSGQALGERPHGFRPESVATFELSFPFGAYNEGRLATFFGEAARRLRGIPGVRAVGFSTSLPWTGYDENSSLTIPGYVARPGESVMARYQAADPGFFDAIGTRVVSGRGISTADGAKAPKVLVVNEALVRRYFPGRDAVGRTITVWGRDRRIVGVVEDVRDRPADVEAVPAFWMPMEQQPFWRVRAAVRTAGDPMAVMPAARTVLRSMDRDLPVAEVERLDEIAAVALADRQFALRLCEAFALLAMALAGVGVYATMTYSVEQRRREIGIRLALGATRGRVLGMVFGSGLRPAVIGVVLGLVLAPAAGSAMASLLYGVSPRDTLTLIAAPAAIVAIAVLGCAAPGLAAVRSEPMATLREQ